MPKFLSWKNFNLKWIIGLTIIVVAWVNFNQEKWLHKDVIAHDIVNYNAYLPALFYEKDLSLSFLFDTVNAQTDLKLYSPNHTPEGHPVIKMSMGMAVTYLPFFGLAHLYTKISDYPTDGYSTPYHFAIHFSSLVYYILGLLFCYKILRRYFPEKTVNLTLLCLTFSTNVFFYLTLAGGLAHIIGFTFIAAFLHYSIKWHDQPKIKTAIIIGCIGGLLVLVRPINLLVLLFFVLYPIRAKDDITNKARMLWDKKNHIVLFALFVLLFMVPQFLYWKHVTGRYIFNSYVGEHFFFDNPHIFKALLGFRKGWLIYTPIMIFSVIGLFFLKEKLKTILFPIIIFFTIYVYVAFSWWCWWYGGSFGQRVLIDIYPILAIPFAASINVVQTQTALKKTLIYSLIVFFTFLNLFQTMQAKYNILHYDSMTFENYREIFFTTTKKPDREKYLKHPDYEKAKRGEDEE